MESNSRKATAVAEFLLKYPGVQRSAKEPIAAVVEEALDERDALWKRAIGEVLKGNPEIAANFLEALGKTVKALRETLSH